MKIIMALDEKLCLTIETLRLYDKETLLNILEDYMEELRIMKGELYEYEQIISARCR